MSLFIFIYKLLIGQTNFDKTLQMAILLQSKEFDDFSDGQGTRNISLVKAQHINSASLSENGAEESVTITPQQKKKAKNKRNRRKKKAPQATSDTTLENSNGQIKDGCTSTIILDARDVAKAAGVNWGDEEATPRMVELQHRHNSIVDIAEDGKLTLLHIKEHNEFLATLTRQIADEGELMKRRFRIATAKQVRSTDMKRAATHQAQAASIQRRQKRYNNEVAMTQCEVDWLRNSPAYTQAMEFLDEHWIKTAKGDYVSKKDLNDDMSTSFEDLLSSMKLEEQEDVQ